MKLLFLAPQPFFQDRGTPIAVRLALRVLADRQGSLDHTGSGSCIDLLTYHEGQDFRLDGINHSRIKMPARLGKVGPGISIKKVLCDLSFFYSALVKIRNSRSNQYTLIHAVEESVFMAWLFKRLYGIPYVYDMDSSLALQVVEKWHWAKPLLRILQKLEQLAVRDAVAVIPVCDALAEIADRHGSVDTQILRDISLLSFEESCTARSVMNFRDELHLPKEALVTLYVGNLEKYQGIDLLIDSFKHCLNSNPNAHLVIVGGSDADCRRYRERTVLLEIAQNVHLVGAKPLHLLGSLLKQADILVSPRTLGNNTPMKIYSYLHSGIPTLATNLPTHTQVLSDSVAVLAEPTIEDFSSALSRLLSDEKLRATIGQAAKELAEEKYTYEVFSRDLNSLYDRLESSLSRPAKTSENCGSQLKEQWA